MIVSGLWKFHLHKQILAKRYKTPRVFYFLIIYQIIYTHLFFSQEKINSQSIDTSNNASNISEESVLYCKKLKSFECGECLVDQQVILSLMIKNIGGEGRFFIMSEIDWCSMHIEDVTNDNMLILPSFAMWPVYFTLKSQEYIYLYIYFFPDAHGMHVNYNVKKVKFYIFFYFLIILSFFFFAFSSLARSKLRKRHCMQFATIVL